MNLGVLRQPDVPVIGLYDEASFVERVDVAVDSSSVNLQQLGQIID